MREQLAFKSKETLRQEKHNQILYDIDFLVRRKEYPWFRRIINDWKIVHLSEEQYFKHYLSWRHGNWTYEEYLKDIKKMNL